MVTDLFFNDKQAIMDYFNSNGVLVSPECMDYIQYLQMNGTFVADTILLYLKENGDDGYLGINTIKYFIASIKGETKEALK